MEPEGIRRTDRIAIELRILVFGTDALGRDFMDESQTLVVSRGGAKILLNRKLVPDQEVSIRCIKTGRESGVRVVGQIGESPGGQYYGVEILDLSADLWGIDFPPLSDSEKAVTRVLLECVRCRSRELAYLNELETEVFEANQSLSRKCKRCRDVTLWKRSEAAAPSEQAAAPPSPSVAAQIPPASGQVAANHPQRTRSERKQVRVNMQLRACIRTARYGEDVVTTGNVCRGGFCFKSPRHYEVGNVVEACVPHTPGGANIFTPARIAHARELPDEHMGVYGVAYIPAHKGWRES